MKVCRACDRAHASGYRCPAAHVLELLEIAAELVVAVKRDPRAGADTRRWAERYEAVNGSEPPATTLWRTRAVKGWDL